MFWHTERSALQDVIFQYFKTGLENRTEAEKSIYAAYLKDQSFRSMIGMGLGTTAGLSIAKLLNKRQGIKSSPSRTAFIIFNFAFTSAFALEASVAPKYLEKFITLNDSPLSVVAKESLHSHAPNHPLLVHRSNTAVYDLNNGQISLSGAYSSEVSSSPSPSDTYSTPPMTDLAAGRDRQSTEQQTHSRLIDDDYTPSSLPTLDDERTSPYEDDPSSWRRKGTPAAPIDPIATDRISRSEADYSGSNQNQQLDTDTGSGNEDYHARRYRRRMERLGSSSIDD